MNTFQSIILIGLAGNVIIGALVWGSNPKRPLNRYFLLTTFLILCWLLGLYAITFQPAPRVLLFFSRQVSVAAGFLPLGFFILRLVITEPRITVFRLCYKLRYLFLAAFSILILCQTHFFMRATYFSSPEETIPIADYGPGFFIFIAYFIAMVICMVVSVRKTFQTASGVQRTESQFLLLGWMFSFSFGLVLFTISNLKGTQEATRFLPLFGLIMNCFVAYGIATRRILSVSEVLQRLTAYILMALCLVGVYVFTERLVGLLFYLVIPDTTYLSHLLAALVMAFSVLPAHGWMHGFSQRIFSAAPLNVDEILSRAGHIFQEMSTEANLLKSFSDLISKTFGVTQVVLLRPTEEENYVQSYPISDSMDFLTLESGSSLIRLLERDREPFAVETLQRMRPTALVTKALEEMQSAGAAIVLGSFSRKEIKSVLVLGTKSTGKIYDLHDQRALQLLSDQLAVAMENARLYTAVQNSKIYNETLLDSLASGIVAVNEDRKITVFNRQAQKLTGLAEIDVVGKSMSVLPQALADSISGILQNDEGFRDRELSIEVGEEVVPIRASSSVFHGHTGEMLGVLLVFSDMTLLKKMEEQIRRADRLASIGTLSAGMAHEIKNPLVTIKTFTQLFPHQHNNEDFQNTFFDLVGQEVERIDVIVNRLLNFARPAKAALKPISLHEVVENSLNLIGQQLAQKDISLEVDLSAKQHVIQADAEQLNQTFINFFLNAVQAMEKGGMLSVKTSRVKSSLQLDIRDTGCGIPADQVDHVFDPFFTTKEEGVGLGLSVSHGIIQEHNGTIDVESVEGKGTLFRLLFPLMETKEASKK